ncbi:MAG TPA: hypothetical protein VJH04_00035 [archaeon]|nr:hypothetical protein [archaeon]
MQCETSCECDSGDYYDFLEKKLMAMTFWAHKQVLFDKIKEKIAKEEGEKLDRIAELLVSEWKSNAVAEKQQEDFSEKLRELFE